MMEKVQDGRVYAVPKSKRVIDEEETEGTSSSSVMDGTEKVILDPARIQAMLNANGGKFDHWRISSNNDDYFVYDSPTVIIRANGSEYKNALYVARTFLIDANAFQSKAYEVLLKAHEAAIIAIKPWNKVSAVYSAALAVVQMDAHKLVPNLTMTVVTGIGLVFCESGSAINPKNDPRINAGSAYNISLGFRNLWTETDNLKSQIFSLLLGDTVVVTNDGCDVITQLNSKDVKDVIFSFNDAEKELELEPGVKAVYSGSDILWSKATLRSDKKVILKEELRRQHLGEFAGRDSSVGCNWANLKTSNELIGSRYNNYCSTVAKTFLIDANAFLSRAYKYLLRTHEVALNAVKPGNKLSAVYSAALAVVQMDAPELVPNLTKTAGTGVVLEFCESGLAINLNKDKVIISVSCRKKHVNAILLQS